MPPYTVKVDRSTPWGNPFTAKDITARSTAIKAFEQYMAQPAQSGLRDAIKDKLRGKNLACWCPLDAPCHADILLAIANE